MVSDDAQIMGNFDNEGSDEEGDSASGDVLTDYSDSEDSDLVKEAKSQKIDTYDYDYTERDIILYNLGIGATEEQIQYTFEGSSDFQALPTFGVIPQFGASSGIPRAFHCLVSPDSADGTIAQLTGCPTSTRCAHAAHFERAQSLTHRTDDATARRAVPLDQGRDSDDRLLHDSFSACRSPRQGQSRRRHRRYEDGQQGHGRARFREPQHALPSWIGWFRWTEDGQGPRRFDCCEQAAES